MVEGLPPRPSFLPPGFGTVGHKEFVEIAAPLPISYKPQTAGWYVLGGLVLILSIWSSWRGVSRYRRNAYRRAALAELEMYRAKLTTQRNAAITEVPGLLKRCALAAFPRRQVASLSGERWFTFLDNTAPGVWDEQTKAVLETVLIRSADDLPRTKDIVLFGTVERWIRRHRA